MENSSKIIVTEDPRLSKLERLFQRASSLPQLPTALSELLKAVEDETSSAHQIEKVIVSDPTLAAKVLQVANSATGGGEFRTANIRDAVLRIGISSIRSLALSLIISGEMPTPGTLKRERVCVHSLTVAFIARYLYARYATLMGPSAWSRDEIFSAALLHDIGCPLLGMLDAPTFERACFYATRRDVTLNEAFKRIFGKDLRSFSGLACEAWNLPDLFLESMSNLSTPWLEQQHCPEISCIAYADYLANFYGKTIEDWPVKSEIEPEIEGLVGIPQTEAKMLMERVSEQVESFAVMFRQAA